MKKRLLRLAALTLTAAVTFTGCMGTEAAAVNLKSVQEKETQGTNEAAQNEQADETQPEKKQEEKVTVGEAADYLVKAADAYTENPDRSEILAGYEEKENEPLTREQCLVMISRAFGTLPKPQGNNARIRDKDVSYSDVPESAQEAAANLLQGGILVNTEDGLLKPKEEVTFQEMDTITRRIYALMGSSLKDDFYNTVNKKELDTKEIPAGETDAGSTYDLRIKVSREINEIIQEIASGSGYEDGSREQKIKGLYLSALDYGRRNELGAEPIRKYLDALDQAQNIEQLSASQIESLRDILSGGLFSYMYMTDFRDSQKKTATVMSPLEPILSEEDFEDTKGAAYMAMAELNETLLKLSGESAEDAHRHNEEYMQFQKKMLAYMPAPEDYQDSSKMNKVVTLEEFKAMLPNVDVEEMIKVQGYKLPEEINIMSPGLFEGFCRELQDESSFNAIKTGLKLNMITSNYLNLSDDFREAFDRYNEETIGQAPSESSPEEVACALVQNSLSGYIEQLYVEKYFPEEAKKDVENMVKQFIEVYKERVKGLDWMGEETKEKAVEKLDGMHFLIGYPDEWEDSLKDLKITGDYFQNQIEISKLQNAASLREAEEGTSKRKMALPATEVNAYYDQFSNTMCFPAAILQAPNYDVNASMEENLGHIGAVIAHEITHAFDNNGARFDKDGKESDWWTEKDYENFQNLCRKAEDFYDGWEAAPGIAISGSQTLGENIADIGGVACALEVLKQTDDPDYDKFFRAYAQFWLKCTTRERTLGLQSADEHSPSNLRVNRVLSNFQEFYDTYGIQEGDGMYVPPQDRIHIW